MPEVQSRSDANPRRLPRRNHYQEGPDFLFVATQGGRPPDPALVPGVAAVVRRRRAALRRWAEGEPVTVVCAETGCSRASLFRWRNRLWSSTRATKWQVRARPVAMDSQPGTI